MIKVNELRVGNFLFRHMPEGKEVIVVEEIRRSDAPGARYLVKNFLCPVYEHELSGIPLTDKWLLKLGFNENHDGHFVLEAGRQSFRISIDEGDNILSYKGDVGLSWYDLSEVLYVHQIQNLYHALTGEELQIKE